MTLLYFITFILACCNLFYELLIAQTIVSLAANTVVWYSLTVGIYLLAMGVGALNCKRVQGRATDSQMLFKTEIYLSVLGALCVLFIHFGHMLLTYLMARNLEELGIAVFFGLAFITAFVIGFFSGLELPLLISLGNKETKEPLVNRILSADYFGSLAAAIIFPLVLVPHVELVTVGFGVALVNILVALIILQVFNPFPKKIFSQLKIAFIALLLMAGFIKNADIEQYFLQKYYYYPEAAQNMKTLFGFSKTLPKVDHYQSLYQEVDIVHFPEEGNSFSEIVQTYTRKSLTKDTPGKDHLLYLDKSLQFWFNLEELYHEYFAHVPIAINQIKPTNVLVLGAGDGLLVRELVKYPEIKTITLVELDGKMIDLAKHHPLLKEMNHQALEDPRVKIMTGDAFHYLRKDSKKYDAIYIDFPDPKNYDLSKLYSLEFYTFVKNHLTDNGFAVFNTPRLSPFSEKRVHDLLVNTLLAAGFQGVIPFASQLETSNPQARALLGIMLKDTSEMTVKEDVLFKGEARKTITDKEEMITKVLQDFSDDYQQNFFMMKKEPMTLDPKAVKLEIALNILNPQRLMLTMEDAIRQHQNTTYTRNAKVNSIFHPQIPDLSFWWRPNLPF